ncbi:MAG: ABC transporter substrate-binding protein [Candidatus Cloacimonetes bacterium]|nr:ABC transporter substrate-binding protein [Candidatus Cloacimonadota bacterium]
MTRMLLILLAAILVLSACSSRDDRLALGIIRPSLNHLPVQVALRQSFLSADDVDIRPLATGWETGEALAAGRLDMAVMPFTYAWRSAAAGMDVRIVSFLERESNGLLARPGLDSLPALDGARVGVLRASTLELLAAMAATDLGLRLEPVPLRSPGEMLVALRSGEVDAVSYYVPPILVEGREPLLWYGSLYPMHPCCDIAAHTVALDEKRAQVERVLDAIEQAVDWMSEHPAETAAIAAEVYGLEPQMAAEALRHVHYRTGLDAAGMTFERRAVEMLLAQDEIERIDGFEIYHAPGR